MIQRLSHPTEINQVGKESSSKCQPKRSICNNPVVNPKGCILYPKEGFLKPDMPYLNKKGVMEK
jgi:hypothetical protein